MIIGHKNQWNLLTKAAKLGRLSHAYLFSGPEKVGKKKLALEFAKYLNCSSQNKPCQKCKSCQDIENMTYPDFILVKPESSSGEIQISQIRDLNKRLSLKPYLSSFKIAVLDKVHSMGLEAQSSFLKLLEEPRGKTILILITQYPEMLLPTIVSRVQKIKFFPVSIKEIKNYLLEQGVLKEKAEEICSFCFGKPGLALEMFSNPQELEKKKVGLEQLKKVIGSDISFRFHYAKNLSEEKEKAKETLDLWLNYFRNVFLFRLGIIENKVEDFKQYSLEKVKEIIRNIQLTEFLISTTNVNLKLALEVLLLKL